MTYNLKQGYINPGTQTNTSLHIYETVNI